MTWNWRFQVGLIPSRFHHNYVRARQPFSCRDRQPAEPISPPRWARLVTCLAERQKICRRLREPLWRLEDEEQGVPPVKPLSYTEVAPDGVRLGQLEPDCTKPSWGNRVVLKARPCAFHFGTGLSGIAPDYSNRLAFFIYMANRAGCLFPQLASGAAVLPHSW